MTSESIRGNSLKGEFTARQLARELGAAEEAVIEEYRAEVKRMRAQCGVAQFVDLLAVKHVRASLLKRRREPHA